MRFDRANSPSGLAAHRLMPPLLAALVVLAGVCTLGPGCQCPVDEKPAAEATMQHPTLRFSHNWGNGPGCLPKGAEMTLVGTIVIRPFGKGTDGVLLKTKSDEWILSYHSAEPLSGLRGKVVRARGRACDKQGESAGRKHFDLSSLTVLPDRAR